MLAWEKSQQRRKPEREAAKESAESNLFSEIYIGGNIQVIFTKTLQQGGGWLYVNTHIYIYISQKPVCFIPQKDKITKLDSKRNFPKIRIDGFEPELELSVT